MKYNKLLPSDILTEVEKLVSENKNPNYISKFLNKKLNFEIEYGTLSRRIKTQLQLQWNKELSKYDKYVKKKKKSHKKNLAGQLNLFNNSEIEGSQQNILIGKDSDLSQNNINVESDFCNIKEDSNFNSKSNISDEQNFDVVDLPTFDSGEYSDFQNLLLNSLDTLNNNIKRIETRLKKVENFMSALKTNNPYNKIREMTDDFISIYASEKDKKSVNINTEIRDRVLKQISQSYGIKNNASLAINTALLISLYNENK
ncbi:MAG: hypothetical protein FH761_07135 [Firmicutes bacterium]|nr:hypothetical protein [Bacillota bacterium]